MRSTALTRPEQVDSSFEAEPNLLSSKQLRDPSTGSRWPELTFPAVPPPGTGGSLARRVRALLGAGNGRISMRHCCAIANVEFRRGQLRTAEGGCEALLVPLRSGGFRIVVDATPRDGWCQTPIRIRAEVAAHRTRFRIAHELAHTFFYARPGGRPARVFPGGSTAEEGFADEFARELLAPSPARSISATDIVALRAQWDVSLEVAARACVEATMPQGAVIWRWRPGAEPSELVVTQWRFGVPVERRFDPRPARLGRARLTGALRCLDPAGALSAAVLEERCQAIAVLA